MLFNQHSNWLTIDGCQSEDVATSTTRRLISCVRTRACLEKLDAFDLSLSSLTCPMIYHFTQDLTTADLISKLQTQSWISICSNFLLSQCSINDDSYQNEEVLFA